MSGTGDLDTSDDIARAVENERIVVKAWSGACPSLRSIILPKGQMWCNCGGEWFCTGEAEELEPSLAST